MLQVTTLQVTQPFVCKPRNTLPLAVFLLVVGCGFFVLHQSHEIQTSKEQQVVQQILATQESELSRRLSYMLSSTYFLAQEVARSQGEFDYFDEYAASILQRMEGISNLQLAPNGVISRIYPLAGNEAAIGHDILKDDRRREEAIDAVRERTLTLAGPFELLQGGTAVIGRNPVFLTQADGGEKFWGFTSALILLKDLIGGSGLNGLPSTDYVYELSRIIPETSDTSVFASNGDSHGVDMQSIEIVVPNGSWKLSIGYLENSKQPLSVLGPLSVFLIALAFAFITRRIVDEPEKLRGKVAEQTQELHKLAYFDALTGLPNRHNFNETLRTELQQCLKSDNGLALLLMDLDNFKDVNDTLGHDMGDQLLIQAGERLLKIMPKGATLARLGGDEFTVILVDAEYVESAESLSKEIIRTIGQAFDLDGNITHISASIGIASVSHSNRQPGELFKCADQAMYEVKRAGGGSFIHFAEAIQQQIALRSQLINDLRLSTTDGSLQLLFHPIISTGSGCVDKAEALLRWHHPTKGTICPSIFIPLAEEFGMINELGDWVFKQAIQQASCWRQLYNEHFQISINVSPVQFSSDGQIHQWIAAAKANEFDVNSVLIEITESLLLENNQGNTELLSLIKEAGFQVALDDFGTGYSSLSYLKMLDIEFLKIDRSFVRNLHAGSSDLVLCRAIIDIAEGMGFAVVAEGVETIEQQTLLCDIGCQYLQGFLYSKPIPSHEFEQLFFGQSAIKSSLASAA